MKVEILSPRIGRRLLKADERNRGRQVADTVREVIEAEIINRAVKRSPGKMRSLLKWIRRLGEGEAMRMFGMAVKITQTARTGIQEDMAVEAFSHADLSSYDNRTVGAIKTNSLVRQAGTIYWQNLSESWVDYKGSTRPQSARKFFVHHGSLQRLLLQHSTAYVRRLGGVKADAAVAREKRGPVQARELKTVLGEITVTIFPNINMSLLPMMSSNRWTSHNEGAFERRFFSGQMREKLIGPEGKHRPLILPITQFWMMFRIPKAVAEAVNRWAKSSSGGG